VSQNAALDASLKNCRLLLREQKFAEAIKNLQILLVKDAENEDALELLGLAQFMSKDYAGAKESYETLTRVNPSLVKASVNLGAVLNRLGDHRKAVDILRRTLQKDRKCAEAYYNMGIAQKAMNLNTMAISAYKEAIKIKPELIEAHLNLGNIYVEMKNMGLALQCFQTALKHDPNSKKAKAALENAQANQKTLRKSTSPFGRLVDIEQLDKQNAETTRRVLTPQARVAERELVQEVTKKVRADAKELVPVLEQSLPAQLHRLERVVLETDNKLSSAEHFDSFEESLTLLSHLKASISDELKKLRDELSSGRAG
jgi:tetratricopeptide (TPR) repeat protein